MDQNTNMGGFAPNPGQGAGGNMGVPAMPAANAMGAAPMGAPAAPAAPTMPTPGMPTMASMPGAAPVATTQTDASKKQKSTLIETIILVVVCLIASVAIVMAVIFFMQYNDLKTNYDSEKNKEVATARADAEAAANENCTEKEKLPYTPFTGPSDYGSISFDYPKNWSMYVDSDGSNNSDYVAYFAPNAVSSIKDKDARYALRFTILNKQITAVQKEYDARVTKGELRSEVFNADNNKITGTKFTGQIDKEISGIVVLVKINDKTLVMQTDAMTYAQDFETVISKLRRNTQ